MPNLQPPPYQSAQGSIQWHSWYRVINDLLSRVSSSIDGLDDVTILGAELNDFLVFTDEGLWENQTAAQAVEALGLDTGDAVVFDTLDVETLTAEDIEGATALWTGNVDIEGVLSGPTDIEATDLEVATGLFTGNVEIEGAVDVENNQTIDGTITINSTVNPTVFITSSNSGATVGPALRLYRNSASPADADNMGVIRFSGNTDDGAGGVSSSDVIYARMRLEAINTGNAEKASELTFGTRVANTLANRIHIGGALYTAGLADTGAG